MANAHLDAIFDNWKAMDDIHYRLNYLAKAFDVTGNAKVARQLSDIASEVMQWAETLRDTHSDKLSDDLAFSKQATANILTAFIGGAQLAGKET